MPPLTLLTLATRAAIRNVAGITDFADMPLSLVQPILNKVQSPKQLYEIEFKHPELRDHTAKLWKAYIARDIPDWSQKIFEPEHPHEWWKVYKTLWSAETRQKSRQESALRQKLQHIGAHKTRNEMEFIPKILPEPSNRSRYVDGNLRVRKPAVRKPNMRTAKTGKDIISAIRRESHAATVAKGLTRAVHQRKLMVPDIKTQIPSVPQNMLPPEIPERSAQNPLANADPPTNRKLVRPARNWAPPNSQRARNNKKMDEVVRQHRAELKEKEVLREQHDRKESKPKSHPTVKTKTTSSASAAKAAAGAPQTAKPASEVKASTVTQTPEASPLICTTNPSKPWWSQTTIKYSPPTSPEQAPAVAATVLSPHTLLPAASTPVSTKSRSSQSPGKPSASSPSKMATTTRAVPYSSPKPTTATHAAPSSSPGNAATVISTDQLNGIGPTASSPPEREAISSEARPPVIKKRPPPAADSIFITPKKRRA